jgi:hypothetical protein
MDVIQNKCISAITQSQKLPLFIYGSVDLDEFLVMQKNTKINDGHVLRLNTQISPDKFEVDGSVPPVPIIQSNNQNRGSLSLPFFEESICTKGLWKITIGIEFVWDTVPQIVQKQFDYISWLARRSNVYIVFKLSVYNQTGYEQFANLLKSWYPELSTKKFSIVLTVSNEDMTDENLDIWAQELKSVIKRIELMNIVETNPRFGQFLENNDTLEHIEFVITDSRLSAMCYRSILKSFRNILYSRPFMTLKNLKKLSFHNDILFIEPDQKVVCYQDVISRQNQDVNDNTMIDLIIYSIHMTDIKFIHINSRSVLDYDHLLCKICSGKNRLSRIRFTNSLPKNLSSLLNCKSLFRCEIALDLETSEVLLNLNRSEVPLQIIGSVSSFNVSKLTKMFGFECNDDFGFYTNGSTVIYINGKSPDRLFAYIHHYPFNK